MKLVVVLGRALWVSIVMLGVSSCGVLAPRNQYFEYAKPWVATERGEFGVGFEPQPRLERMGNRSIEIWAQPFTFNTQYVVSTEGVESGELRNIQIRSLETGKKVFFESMIIDVDRKDHGIDQGKPRLIKSIGFGASGLDIAFHDYEVDFDFIIYKTGKRVFDQGHVHAVVERDYYEGWWRRGVGFL